MHIACQPNIGLFLVIIRVLTAFLKVKWGAEPATFAESTDGIDTIDVLSAPIAQQPGAKTGLLDTVMLGCQLLTVCTDATHPTFVVSAVSINTDEA